MLENGKKYIVEARVAWTDCVEYEYVYGKCSIFDADKEAGFVLRRSENWFLKVEGDNGEVIIPGCKVGTLVKTDVTPVEIRISEEDARNNWRNRNTKVLVL